MSAIRIPPELRDAVEEDDYPERLEWLAALPGVVEEIATEWELELGEPYLPGGQCAWVAPARDDGGDELVLKVGWRHREAEHEADALRFWNGDGAVRCLASLPMDDTAALLLERCVPGIQLKRCLPEPDQDDVIAGLMLRLWARHPSDGHPFGSLQDMCDQWAESVEIGLQINSHVTDPGLARAGAAMLRELARTADRNVLLSTDLHAENVLSTHALAALSRSIAGEVRMPAVLRKHVSLRVGVGRGSFRVSQRLLHARWEFVQAGVTRALAATRQWRSAGRCDRQPHSAHARRRLGSGRERAPAGPCLRSPHRPLCA